AAIAPSEIGPNIAHPGPLCQILTRGAPTRVASKTIKGRITSTSELEFVWMTRNEQTYPVTMTGDSLSVPATLEEGDNLFTLWAVDMNGDTGRSAQMNFPMIVDHAPDARIVVNIGDASIFLVGSSSTDPQNDPLTYHWTQDEDNPEQVTLGGADNATASFVIPETHGEYYFNLDVTDTEQNTTRARTFIRVNESGESAFQNDEVAEWVDNAIMYEIFPRAFSAQGNLQGITAGLPRIAELGASVIWLMPIFEGPSDHGYEITDYYSIEQDYGNADDLHELVESAHDLGIRVILDMVINHTGIGHPFMQDAQRFGRNSFYWDWYDRDGAGNYTYYFDWSSLPNINLDNPETARYYIDMCKWWIEEFDIDGYRCDVAWGPMQRTPEFWVNWRAALKEIKPEVLLLAETGANDFAIFEDRFDLALDWNLHHEGAASFADMFPSIPSFTNLTDLITNYGFPWPEYKNPLRFMENHDESRYISYKTPAQTKLVSELMFTIPGVPMIYAGQEIGETSQRGVIGWGTDANSLYPHYYRLMNARKILPAMRTGDFTLIPNSQTGACYSFARTGEGMDPVVFLGNFSSVSQVVSVTIDPTLFGLHPDSTYVVSEILGGTHYESLGSGLTSIFTSLSSYSGRVWVISDSVITTDAPEHTPEIPKTTELLSPYPNPFNPLVTIPFELARAGRVQLRVFDVLGRTAAILQDGLMTAGTHNLAWDGSGFSSGVYFATLEADGVRQTRKILLLK
ncbi:T9SS type A sorting domain-containing protein, partial [bacterium]|nr:T9SS type A sorting domain-containing protein [bacterium]